MKKARKPQPEGWMTLRHERRDYGFYMIGQNIIYEFVSSYLVTYMLMYGITPMKTASAMLAVKVWDAVNDVLFGGIFDKVKWKKQVKFLPWLRYSLLFIILATVLMFSIPSGFTEGRKLIWFVVAYILWDTAYTLCDVPIYGIVTTMTSDLNERTTIMSHSRIYAALGAGLAMAFGSVLVSRNVGMSYMTVSIISGVIAMLTMLPISIRGKERNYTAQDQEQEFSLGEMMRYLFSNKYLLIFFGAYLISHALGTTQVLGMFASFYLFGNEMFNLVLMGLSVIPGLFLAILSPRILQKVDKYKLFFYSNIASAAMGFLIYMVGYENKFLFIVLTVLRGLPDATILFLVFMFTPDCAEYGKFKTGTDARGITFAMQTFSAKMTGALGSSVGVFVLGLFGWKEVKAESFAELVTLTDQGFRQSTQAIDGLWFTYALIPVVGLVLSLFLLYFYRLSNQDVQVMSDCNAGKITREEAIESLSPKIKREFVEN